MRSFKMSGAGMRILLVTLVLSAATVSVHAQWATNGNNINNTNSGNVGVGTTNPFTKLHVNGGDISMNADAAIRRDGNQAIFAWISSLPGVSMGSGSVADKFKINAGGVERLRIDTTGNVGISTQTPNNLLHLRDPNYTQTPSSIPSTSVMLYLERDF